MRYIAALDEGTTATRAVLFDLQSEKIVKSVSAEIKQYYPEPSFVEEDAEEIYFKTREVLDEILDYADGDVAGVGVTNQRETVVAWDTKSGKPLCNAIVWQCRRTADFMASLDKNTVETIRKKTGLLPDAYFSASKIKWLIDNVPQIKTKLEKGEVCFGTIDSYLIYRFTDGKSFVTDATNASRTMLFNINTLKWDDDLLEIFGVPKSALPTVVPSDYVAGEIEYKGKKIPICGIAGDQQAAAVGQCCFNKGECKATYGTGLFMLCNTGEKPVFSQKGLLTTIAYKLGDRTVYALEGSVFNAGSTIQWLRDGLEFFRRSEECESLAVSVKDNGGVYLVPAFTGLGAPHWAADARGMICGLTRGAGKAHITRAALESIAYSAKDLAEVMRGENGKISVLRVDGGASANNFLMQFQADVLGEKVDKPCEKESTALGAVYLCALGLKILSFDKIAKMRKTEKIYFPQKDGEIYKKYYDEWLKAVERCVYGK